MLPVGGSFDRFRIDALLGEGGMGRVYQAFDTRLHRAVALKVLLEPAGEDECARSDALARLLREARTAASLEHPHMIAIYDVGDVEGVAFIAMEFVAGKTLRTFVGKPPPWPRKLGWLLAAAAALDAAHARGVVHRDVKPENVMLRDDGVVKVLDFGIARRTLPSLDGGASGLGAAATTTPTGGPRIMGTPAYMAPEQLGGYELDGRADQFAFGVMAYELLTGQLPWITTHGSLGVVAGLLTAPPRPLRAHVPDLPRQVDEAVLRALAKHRDDRFRSMRELAAVLEPFAALAEPTRVSALTPPPPSPRAATAPATPVVARVTAPATGTRVVSSDAPLAFKVDAEARFARFPAEYTLKGMFFSRLVSAGGRHVEAVRSKLRSPPRTGRYLPFSDYPQVDYSRIAHSVAIGLRPDLPVPEAMRQLARADFVTFAQSSVGRVSLALLGDVGSALLKVPDMFAAVMRGGTVTARRLDRCTIELTFRDFFGWVDCYPMGTLEGLVRRYGVDCTIEADVVGAADAVVTVHLRPESRHA